MFNLSVCAFAFAVKVAVSKLKQLRLQRDDFETLKVIGRGAFGEVHTICTQSYTISLFSDQTNARTFMFYHNAWFNALGCSRAYERH